MTLTFAVLGSGSSGNCTVVRLDGPAGRRHVLIDAGLSPRETTRRLATLDVEHEIDIDIDIDEIDDVFVTHLDHDHLHRGWASAVGKSDVRLHVHRQHRRAAIRAGFPVRHLHEFDEGVTLSTDTRVEAVLLAHDALGSVGYVVEHCGARFGLATDLGRVPRAMLERFSDLGALAIESNYDRTLQVGSDRPEFLKSRIMGGAGHLSNDQALRAVLDIAGRSALSQLVLLHVSRDCNDPKLIRRLYASRAPRLLDVLTIATHDEPTAPLKVRPAAPVPEQLVLFG